MKRQLLPSIILASFSALVAVAATPPTLLNYQGVLRNASDAPQTGTYDMVFRFFDAATLGNEILVDSHTAGGASAVSVSGGLFNVQLGGGTVTDGSGPGSYSSLGDVFRDHGTVHLEIQIGAETLSPRTRVLAAAYAMNATNLGGKSASQFLDTSSTSQTKTGWVTFDGAAGGLPYGVTAFGTDTGLEATGDTAGVLGTGGLVGGWFTGANGVEGHGTDAGGFFRDSDSSAYANVGHAQFGIEAHGTSTGGRFKADLYSGDAYAGYLDSGIEGYGNDRGGFFRDSDNGGYASVGVGYEGIRATGAHNPSGSNNAGYFNTVSNAATETFIVNWNPSVGGTGVYARGTYRGGYFGDSTTTADASVGIDTYKIFGTGVVSFVQNHPIDRDRVIVYAAPEGDEVATYTRGQAKLSNGEARVTLGETFQWVTNPDIGLTAQVTARGEPIALAVDSVSTTELVVRGPRNSDATFDYVVYGLRIGFEESTIVQPKLAEAPTPSFVKHMARYEAQPETRRFNALERFTTMRAATGDTSPLTLSASKALHAAINAGVDPERRAIDAPEPVSTPSTTAPRAEAAAVTPREARESLPTHGGPPEIRDDTPSIALPGPHEAPSARPLNLVRVSEPVEPGDVLVVDRDIRGAMRLGFVASDPTFVGVVIATDAAMSIEPRGTPIALAGTVVPCKVDASFGAIHVGDLLTVSPTRGHAMRATDTAPGTIVGKALEDLEVGIGVVQTLVMPR